MAWVRRENIVRDKSFDFALKIIDVSKDLNGRNEYVMSRQILRAGTAIGALIREGEYAQSKADFINKMSIALKEANEACYWLELLSEPGYIDKKLFDQLSADAIELLKLLTSIINKAKKGIMNNE